MQTAPVVATLDRREALHAYLTVRQTTEALCRPLQTEDYVIQSMEDVSPPKWHLGHTSWFFETFLLRKFQPGYRVYHDLYAFLFNSYYESIGTRWARPTRGLLSRPTVKEVYAYRAYVDEKMSALIDSVGQQDWPQFYFLLDLGIHHEQQHEELIVTDMKNILSINPLKPAYQIQMEGNETFESIHSTFIEFAGGLSEIGFAGSGFSFDNERPRHRVWLEDYRLQNRLVTNEEYLAFIRDGGYTNPLLWLSDGWAAVSERGWNAPMYWQQKENDWEIFTLSGLQKLELPEPVCHVSYYEADAYARWAGKRLPTEAELEHALEGLDKASGNFLENGRLHPVACTSSAGKTLHQAFGDVWEWTSSAYLPYPGFSPEPGVVGEYNGKFMSDQMVLRGGSCATPASHIRDTYRNFFQCDKRWQFTGIRLADF